MYVGISSAMKRNIREASIVIPQVRGFRRMGSAAYDLCCTAMGTIDAYWEYNLNLWDVCAGQLIVSEAGGIIVPLAENRKISIIAGPETLVRLLQETLTHCEGLCCALLSLRDYLVNPEEKLFFRTEGPRFFLF